MQMLRRDWYLDDAPASRLQANAGRLYRAGGCSCATRSPWSAARSSFCWC